MEWLKVIAPFLGALAWPFTLLVLVFAFRREIRQRLSSVTELKFPGGSVVLKEVERLEARVQATEGTGPFLVSPVSSSPTHPDSRLAIAQIRLDLERELFRLSWNQFGSADTLGWQVVRHINELELKQVLSSREADDLRSFVQLSDRLIHAAPAPEDTLTRAIMVGATLMGGLRFRRRVADAERDFESHGVWHMHQHVDDAHRKFYFWSAVAATLPEYGYDFAVYQRAATHYLERFTRDHPNSASSFYILTLVEFIEVLKFREAELLRLVSTWDKGWKAFEEANEWKWPKEWGSVGWTSPVLREHLSLFQAEQELLQTRAAIERHQIELRASRSAATA